EECGLAGAVGADDADDAAARQVEVEVLHQYVVAVTLADAFGPHHGAAQRWPGGYLQDQFVLALLILLRRQLFVGAEAGLALGDAGPGCHSRPLQLALQGLAASRLGALIAVEAGLLLLQPAGVVALERMAQAAVQLEDPASDVVEEVAVVGDG